MLKINSMRRGLLLGTEVVGAWLSWYGRAFAGSCSPATGASISCTGPAANGTDVTQNLTITGGGTVSTSGGFGIDTTSKGGNAFNIVGPGTFVDTAASTITSGLTGINATNAQAAGSLAITASGTVMGTSNFGIHATNGTTSNNLTISAANATGGKNGIYAFNHGTGELTVTTSGLVQNIDRGNNGSQLLFGIYGRNAGTNLSVTAAGLTGGQDGVRAINDGTGALSISTTGVVTGVYGDGILGRNNAHGTNLTIVTSGRVNAYRVGIYAKNYGAGTLSVTSTDAVNGLAAVSIGVYARNNATGTGLTISSAGATAGLDGIQARNFGTGSLSVTTSGPVMGTSRYGVFAANSGTNLSVTTGTVTGGTNGIHVFNNGTGSTTISSSGDVTATLGAGIYAAAGNTTTGPLTISQAAGTTITGATDGIVAANSGTGGTSITINGRVTGTSGTGISVNNDATATTLSLITSAPVLGGTNGIEARNGGSGALNLTVNGDVMGASNDGIVAGASGTDLVVTTASGTHVNGALNGIYALNSGTGSTAIISSGDVTGTSGAGIYGQAGAGTTGSLTISQSASTKISGGTDGILATNAGTGGTWITVNGDLTGISGNGISVTNDAKATTLSVRTSAPVLGGTNGIDAVNEGSGAVNLSVNGDVTGVSGEGISVNNFGTGAIIVTAAGTNIKGADTGIIARNAGTGGISISTNGEVTGILGDGISVTNDAKATTLSVRTSAPVLGGTNGINAANAGSGALNITVNGDVTGTSNDGILASNGSTDSVISTAAGTNITGGANGLAMINSGTGSTSILTNGEVTGTSGDGIAAVNAATATILSVTTSAPVTGGTNGINAANAGSGALTIMANGDVTGSSNDGILASNSSTDSVITTAAGTSVRGGTDGISVTGSGAGATTITADGNVTGTSGHGISAVAAGGGVAINIGAASLVQGGIDGIYASSTQSAIAITNAGTIQNLSGQSDTLAIATTGGPTSVSNAGLLTGTVDLGNGGSRFTNNGVWNTAGGTNQFGSGSGNNVTNAAAGTIITANTPAAAQTTRFLGLDTFANAGNITMQDGFAGDRLVINGNFVGENGAVHIDTYLGSDNSPSDRLLVQGGMATGSTALFVARTGGNGAQTMGSGIEVVQTNGSSANAFTLGKPVEAGAYQYLLYRGGVGADAIDQNWYLRSQLEYPVSTSPTQPGSTSPTQPGSTPQPSPVAYRPGVVAYTMTSLLNEEYGFTTLGTLHQRVGDTPGAIDPQQNNASNGVWGRVNASSFDANALGRFSADSTTYFAQFGKDWTLNQSNDGGSTHAGVTLAFGVTSATFRDLPRAIPGLDTRTGTVSTQAESLGGYWTRYLKDGTYFDSVGQVTWYRNRFGGQDGNGSQSGIGTVFSQEVGKPFRVGSTPVAIEPQAQLMYQYLSLGGFNDTVSAVSGTHTNALRGRVGFRIYGTDLPNTDSHDVLSWAKPYLTVDALHDFLRPGQTVVGGTSLNPSLARTSFDVGGGVTAAAGKHAELYAHGGYQHSLGSGYSQGFYGQLAYRYMW